MHRAARTGSGFLALVLAGLIFWPVADAPARGEPEKAPPGKDAPPAREGEAPAEPARPDDPNLFPREGPETAPPLNAEMLSKVKDSKPLPTISGKFDKNGKLVNDPLEAQQVDEAFAFLNVLITAHQTPTKAFANGTRKDLGYANLFNETSHHRGEVVHVEGRMRRLIRWDPPAQGVAVGMRDYYEGWIFNPDLYGPNGAVCVIFTELPDGLQPAEKMDRRVAFDGYLFKKYAYKSADARKTTQHREAPLLIGHAPVVRDLVGDVEASPTVLFTPLLLGVLIFIGTALALIIFLGWWFGRGDQKVHHRLADAAAQRFVDELAGQDAPPLAELANPPPTGPAPTGITAGPEEKNNGNGHQESGVRSQESGAGPLLPPGPRPLASDP
jgi:hypothetical protein